MEPTISTDGCGLDIIDNDGHIEQSLGCISRDNVDFRNMTNPIIENGGDILYPLRVTYYDLYFTVTKGSHLLESSSKQIKFLFERERRKNS